MQQGTCRGRLWTLVTLSVLSHTVHVKASLQAQQQTSSQSCTCFIADVGSTPIGIHLPCLTAGLPMLDSARQFSEMRYLFLCSGMAGDAALNSYKMSHPSAEQPTEERARTMTPLSNS